ncbi:MAG: hypothetical protein JW904_01485 [Spirochaetales bacterium]|nr:hypothetical protein [Spirochaetales bacterium]
MSGCFISLKDIKNLPVRFMDTDEMIRYAPKNTSGIISMSLESLVRDEKFGEILYKATSELSKSASSLEAFHGITMIHTITMYYQESKDAASPFSGLTFIAKLTMDLDKVKKAHWGKINTSTHRTYTLYSFESGFMGNNTFYIVFPDAETIISGTKENVSHILDVKDGLTTAAVLHPNLPKALPINGTTLLWSTFAIEQEAASMFLQAKQSRDPKPKPETTQSSITGMRFVADILDTTINVRMDVMIGDTGEKKLIQTKINSTLDGSMGQLPQGMAEIINAYNIHEQPWGLVFGTSLDKIRIIEKLEEGLDREKENKSFDPDIFLKSIL